MRANLVVDRATPADVPAMLALLETLFAEHEHLGEQFAPAPQWRARMGAWLRAGLHDPARYLAVARAADQIVGLVSATVREVPAFAESPRGLIENLVVAPGRRRVGLGRRLAEAAAAWCEQRGALAIELAVAVDNADGQAFWEACGFEPAMTWRRRPLGPAAREQR